MIDRYFIIFLFVSNPTFFALIILKSEFALRVLWLYVNDYGYLKLFTNYIQSRLSFFHIRNVFWINIKY